MLVKFTKPVKLILIYLLDYLIKPKNCNRHQGEQK